MTSSATSPEEREIYDRLDHLNGIGIKINHLQVRVIEEEGIDMPEPAFTSANRSDEDDFEKFLSELPELHSDERNSVNKHQPSDEENCNTEDDTSQFKPNQLLIDTMKSIESGELPIEIAVDMPKGVFTRSNEKRTPAQERLMWDKRILDLYYLYVNHRKTLYCDNSAGFRKLFAGNDFDLELANQLVTTKGSIDASLNYMGLDTRVDIQLMLCAYRSKKVVQHHKASRTKASITALVYQHTKKASSEDVEQHYQAYMALRLAQGSLVKAVEYSQFLGSKPLSRDQLKRKKNKFEKWFLGSAGKKAKNHWQIL